MAEYTPIGFKGLPEFGERQFVDRKPWVPPLYPDWRTSGDPFWKPSPDLADKSIAEATQTSGVFSPAAEPGPTEFSHGPGLRAPLALGPDPTPFEEYHAVMRTDPADPSASHVDRYSDWTG